MLRIDLLNFKKLISINDCSISHSTLLSFLKTRLIVQCTTRQFIYNFSQKLTHTQTVTQQTKILATPSIIYVSNLKFEKKNYTSTTVDKSTSLVRILGHNFTKISNFIWCAKMSQKMSFEVLTKMKDASKC